MDRRSHSRRLGMLALAAFAVVAALVWSAAASSTGTTPQLVRDVKTGSDTLGSLIPGGPDPIQDYTSSTPTRWSSTGT